MTRFMNSKARNSPGNYKPRLLMICHVPPPVHGAATVSKHVFESPDLQSQFDIELIELSMGGRGHEIRKFKLNKIVRALYLYWRIGRALVFRRPDLAYITVSISGFALWRDLIIVFLLKTFKIPRVFHMHTKGIKRRYDASKKARIAYESLFADARVIHLSDTLASDLDPVTSKKSVHIVANGVAVNCLRRRERRGETPPRILFLSNLMQDKGPLELLAASAILANRQIAHELVFVGAEREPAVTRAIHDAARQDSNRVSFAGPLYGAEKDRVWSETDIFVLPTFYEFECQPLTLIEAMAHGLPSVATREGAISDMISDGVDGLLYDSHDVEALASHLSRLISDAEMRHELGDAAKRKYLERYQLSTFQTNIANLMTWFHASV